MERMGCWRLQVGSFLPDLTCFLFQQNAKEYVTPQERAIKETLSVSKSAFNSRTSVLTCYR